MEIIEATRNDYEAVTELFRELDDYHADIDSKRIRKHEGCSRTEDEYQKYIEGDSSALFLCFKEKVLAGIANVKHEIVAQDRFRVGREYVLLDNLYVKRDYRRKGVGRALYQHVCSLAKNRNVTSMELQVYANNEMAHQFYISMGFKSFMLRMEGESSA